MDVVDNWSHSECRQSFCRSFLKASRTGHTLPDVRYRYTTKVIDFPSDAEITRGLAADHIIDLATMTETFAVVYTKATLVACLKDLCKLTVILNSSSNLCVILQRLNQVLKKPRKPNRVVYNYLKAMLRSICETYARIYKVRPALAKLLWKNFWKQHTPSGSQIPKRPEMNTDGQWIMSS